MTETEQFALDHDLQAKKVTREEFQILAARNAFPFDDDKHKYLRRPFIYSELDNIISAINITKTALYYYFGKPEN